MPQLVTRKRLLVTAALLAFVVIVSMAFRSDPLEVEAVAVAERSMQVVTTAEGRTRVSERYVVTAPVSGRLQRVGLVEGRLVRHGEVLALIAPAPLDEPETRQAQARLDAARAALSEATTHVRLADASVAQADRDLRRARLLEQAGALAARDLEQAELTWRARSDEARDARTRIAAAQADVRQATAALLHAGGASRGGTAVAVHAPAAGRILRLPDRSERVIAAGSPIAELGDTRRIEAVADVLSSDAAQITAGMPVTLTGWGGEIPLQGRVRMVEPAATTRISALGVEEQRVNVIVDVAGAPASLGDGYRVDARIVTWQHPATLVVPPSALVRAGSEWAVFTIVKDHAELRPVKVGAIGEDAVQLLGGARAGERVIVFPSDKVHDGVRVRARG